MSENEPVEPAARAGWRQRTWSLPAVVAVALVAVLLGGLGGAALASVGDHQDGRGSFGPGNGRVFGGPGRRLPGQQPFRLNDPYGDHQHRGPGGGGPVMPLGTPTPTPTPSS